MFLTFMVCVGAFHCLFSYLLLQRLRLAKARRDLSAIRRTLAIQPSED
jgi:hypothetical protein